MDIGGVKINGLCALAPMAGVADRVFRELCVSFGAAYTVGEMVSAKGICMGDKKSRTLLTLSDCERPAAVQLFGSEPEIMAQAAKTALTFNPDIIDINMGCPAPKVIKTVSGSALMKDTALAGRIIKAVCEVSLVPVTVKFRTGWSNTEKNCVELAKTAQENGAAAICIHGRSREQMYSPPADLDSIREVKRAVKIPVIGNGDIFTVQDAKMMYEYTGCDLIMIGRGAMGAPWIFSQVNAFFENGTIQPPPDIETRMEIMLEHSRRICELYGERNGMREIRKHALWYTKGVRGSAKLRNEFSTVKEYNELYQLAKRLIELS